METSATILLILSCAVSFGLGRTFIYFRDKRRNKRKQELDAQIQRNRPAEAESRNKAKRKRQIQATNKKADG